MWNTLRRHLELFDVVLIGFYALMLTLLLPYWDRIPGTLWVWMLVITSMSVVAALKVQPTHPRVALTMRVLIGALTSIPGYEYARLVIEHQQLTDLTAYVAALDSTIFGGHASVWMQRIHHPWLTEYLQFSYLTYYVLPLLFAGWLLARSEWHKLSVLMLGAIMAIHINQALYLVVPVRSPFLLIHEPGLAHLIHYETPLVGVWKTEAIRQWLLSATTMRLDCFPSGHTMLTMTTLLLGWRLSRQAFWWMLPIALSIVFSTIYLRYHYLIDVVVGVVGAVLLAWCTPTLHRLWRLAPARERVWSESALHGGG